MSFDHLEQTPEFCRVLDVIEKSRRHVFLTGRAGTGKSTLLQYFRAHTARNVAVLAPTGVAAVNIKGQTIHSFFGFRPDITPEAVGDIRMRRTRQEMFRALDTIVIDEISMVRADLLDCIDAFLRRNGPVPGQSFGGIQMVLIGDLYQLPPVVTSRDRDIFGTVYPSPYFFDARAFAGMDVELLELGTVYRQKEDRFIRLLNAVRDNAVTITDLSLLNVRVNEKFEPSQNDFFVHLTTTNAMADQVNSSRLSRLPGKSYEYAGDVEGEFESRNLPTHEKLYLKSGAQVMLLNNDPQGRWVNGSIGHLREVLHTPDGDLVRVHLSGGNDVEVAPFTWEMYRFVFNEEEKKVESEIVGMFTQYPLRLAWAVTIHKAQGKTFDKVVIDLGRGTFSHGQAYVALSRCTSLEGIVLKTPVLRQHILLDERITFFLQNFKKDRRKTHLVLE